MSKKGRRGRNREKTKFNATDTATVGAANKIGVVSLSGLLLVGALFWAYQVRTAGSADPVSTPVPSISHEFPNHIHGLGYDSQNQRLYIATHHGLFIWKENQLFQFGKNRDDYMGFSLHPSNPNIFYTSGHPEGGGNMGVMKSEDGGRSFKKVFAGVKGETVDFHSMAISPANPAILYGHFQGKLYRTRDGGKNWQVASAQGLPEQGFCFGAPCLSPHPRDERVLYAGSSPGLFVSRDYGETWTEVNRELGAFAGLGVDPANSQRLFAFTQRLGLASSIDGGKSWQARNEGITLSRKEFIFALEFDRKSFNHLFAATPEQVFRTRNGGEVWEKIL